MMLKVRIRVGTESRNTPKIFVELSWLSYFARVVTVVLFLTIARSAGIGMDYLAACRFQGSLRLISSLR